MVKFLAFNSVDGIGTVLINVDQIVAIKAYDTPDDAEGGSAIDFTLRDFRACEKTGLVDYTEADELWYNELRTWVEFPATGAIGFFQSILSTDAAVVDVDTEATAWAKVRA